jgi:sialic acid synthase SpsE
MNTIESITKTVAIFDKYNSSGTLAYHKFISNSHSFSSFWRYDGNAVFSNKVFGLSDHTNNNACLVAVALGLVF